MQAETVAADLVFPESLRIADGRLWFVDMYDGKLLSVGIDGPGWTVPRCEYAAPTILGGIGFPADGAPLLVDKPARSVLRVAPGSPVYADLSGLGSSMLNDMVMLPTGDLIVGEYGFDIRRERPRPGRLYRVDRSGQAGVFADDFGFPNGMALSGDGRSLFVAETTGRRITRIALSDGGDAAAARDRLVAFESGGPDGLAIDADDRIWAAMIGPSALVRIAPDGRIDRQIPMDVPVFDVAVDPHRPLLYVAVSRARMSDLDAEILPRTGAILAVPI